MGVFNVLNCTNGAKSRKKSQIIPGIQWNEFLFEK